MVILFFCRIKYQRPKQWQYLVEQVLCSTEHFLGFLTSKGKNGTHKGLLCCPSVCLFVSVTLWKRFLPFFSGTSGGIKLKYAQFYCAWSRKKIELLSQHNQKIPTTVSAANFRHSRGNQTYRVLTTSHKLRIKKFGTK